MQAAPDFPRAAGIAKTCVAWKIAKERRLNRGDFEIVPLSPTTLA